MGKRDPRLGGNERPEKLGRWHRKDGTAGIIGVGVIGSAMAKNLVEAGFDLVGYDIAPAAREHLERARRPRRSFHTPPCCAEAEVVITSMPSAKALMSVVDD